MSPAFAEVFAVKQAVIFRVSTSYLSIIFTLFLMKSSETIKQLKVN